MIRRTLGHYKVGEQLGRGGMGEVYVADDLNLNRKVALKFLPEAFTGDPERMARFEREAKLLASLNHPATLQKGSQLPFDQTRNRTVPFPLPGQKGLQMQQGYPRTSASVRSMGDPPLMISASDPTANARPH